MGYLHSALRAKRPATSGGSHDPSGCQHRPALPRCGRSTATDFLRMRHPAMPWYRVIDEATWKAFHEAAGNPATLHEHLVDLLTNPELPWLTIDKSRELGDMVGRQTLRRRGVSSYTYHPRAIQRQVQRAAAFNDVQQFFDLTTRSDKFEVLY